MAKWTYNRIKEILARKGKKNVELARFLGVDPQTVSGWCRNINQPEYSTLFKISDFLEMEAGELITPKKELREVKEKEIEKKDSKNASKKKVKRNI